MLKVGHHGSKYSSSDTFLQNVSPKVAVISCGEGNLYGHPHEETLERLGQAGSLTYVTKDRGAITIEMREEVNVYGFKE